VSANWKVGMQRLAPGVYSDGDGAMHLDLVEMCRAAGYPPTRANQEMLAKAAREQFCGEAPVTELDDAR
jgi:hypothetical protein